MDQSHGDSNLRVEGQVADCLDPDAGCIAGQVCEGNILDIHDRDGPRIGASLDCLRAGFGLGTIQGLISGQ